jgi:hypothetical protein
MHKVSNSKEVLPLIVEYKLWDHVKFQRTRRGGKKAFAKAATIKRSKLVVLPLGLTTQRRTMTEAPEKKDATSGDACCSSARR